VLSELLGLRAATKAGMLHGPLRWPAGTKITTKNSCDAEGRQLSGCRSESLLFLLIVVSFLITGSTATAESYTVYDSWYGVSVKVECSASDITLTEIEGMVPQLKKVKRGNKWVTERLNELAPCPSCSAGKHWNYLAAPVSLLSFYVNDDKKPVPVDVTCPPPTTGGDVITFAAKGSNHLQFLISIAPAYGGFPQTVDIQVQVIYEPPADGGKDPTVFFSTMLPNNLQIQIPGAKAMAMVPQMIGSVLPLAHMSLGLGPTGPPSKGEPAETIGLPTSFNNMEIAELYDNETDSGGVFFTERLGDYGQNNPPLQFRLDPISAQSAAATGYWTAFLKANQKVTLPALVIGFHPSGDWHHAVDYYLGQYAYNTLATYSYTSPDPTTPTWFTEAGGFTHLAPVAADRSFAHFHSRT
jgi:hypothetical protein